MSTFPTDSPLAAVTVFKLAVACWELGWDPADALAELQAHPDGELSAQILEIAARKKGAGHGKH